MGTPRKRSLPLALTILERARATGHAPTVDGARRTLGGRMTSEAGVGRIVTVETQAGRALGVMLFASRAECDVLTEEGAVRRTKPERVATYLGEAPSELARIAADAIAFGALMEGDRVRFEAKGELAEGTLVEKCRYGGLVLRESGKIVAVGFRSLSALSRKPPS